MIEIEIRGRRVPLLYTSLEMKTIQEEIGPIGRAYQMLVGKNPEDPDSVEWYGGKEHLDTLGKMIKILGNAGLEESGEEPDLTVKKVLRGLPTNRIVEAVNTCLAALNDGMRSEHAEKPKEGKTDVTLEEIQKKREAEE